MTDDKPLPSHSAQLAGPSAGEEVYDVNGVDRSLIRWMLSLQPEQRLQILQDTLELMPERSNRMR